MQPILKFNVLTSHRRPGLHRIKEGVGKAHFVNELAAQDLGR